ncbi:hypothetical protein CHARACLAT_020355 [Characodon lateralis]|uniref:Uncharacterized protein n=1 Tax=Characodon lateralis TaxID=208331 RepID=A0ABU7D9A4_9TELE|nr:hypothetical protein [Characodon lateralis]
MLGLQFLCCKKDSLELFTFCTLFRLCVISQHKVVHNCEEEEILSRTLVLCTPAGSLCGCVWITFAYTDTGISACSSIQDSSSPASLDGECLATDALLNF